MEKSSKKFDIRLTIRIDLSVPGTYFLPFLFNTYLKLSLNFSPVNQRQKDLKFRDTGRSRRLRDATISFRISLRWLIHIINSVDKTKSSYNHASS